MAFGAVRIYQLGRRLHCRINAADSERAQVHLCVCGGRCGAGRGKWKETSRQKTAGNARKIERKAGTITPNCAEREPRRTPEEYPREAENVAAFLFAETDGVPRRRSKGGLLRRDVSINGT